jgi:hypothetical protein
MYLAKVYVNFWLQLYIWSFVLFLVILLDPFTILDMHHWEKRVQMRGYLYMTLFYIPENIGYFQCMFCGYAPYLDKFWIQMCCLDMILGWLWITYPMSGYGLIQYSEILFVTSYFLSMLTNTDYTSHMCFLSTFKLWSYSISVRDMLLG